MELGMIGLGRMGANMAQRLHRGGIGVTGFDPGLAARERMAGAGVATAASLEALVQAMPAPRALWLMVPAGAVDALLDQLLPLLSPGDLVVDGGNSWYRDSLRRAQRCQQARVAFVDCGTSGGVWGLQEGYCLMLGGEPAALARLTPARRVLAPAAEDALSAPVMKLVRRFLQLVVRGREVAQGAEGPSVQDEGPRPEG